MALISSTSSICACYEMAKQESSISSGKRCFVTIGATASFNSLVRAVLSAEFIKALEQAKYTELRIQYGDHEGEAIFRSRVEDLSIASGAGALTITGFGFDATGLKAEMIAVKGQNKEHEGLVVSHAGRCLNITVMRTHSDCETRFRLYSRRLKDWSSFGCRAKHRAFA